MHTDTGSLRAARLSRGWSQAHAAAALADLAAERGLVVAAPTSLKTQLSRWENQHVAPEELYRALLCELYQSSDADLGLSDPAATDNRDEAALLRAELASAAAIDAGSVELLGAQLAATYALDNRHGTAAVADTVLAQLSHLEKSLAYATNRAARRRLAELVVAASTIAGRVAVDTCRLMTAWRHYEQARRAAYEAESPALRGCAMAEQAQVLVEIGHERLAVELIEQAIEVAAPDAPGLTLAWLAAGRGDVLAAAGDASQAHSAYDTAEEQLSVAPRVDISFPQVLVTVDQCALHRHRGHASHLLRHDQQAIADLEQALSRGGGSARDVASIHVDLAHAFRATDRRSTARSHARIARDMANRIGSARLAARLDSRTESGGEPLASRS